VRIPVIVLPLAACTTLAPGDHLDPSLRGDPRAVGDDTVVRVISWNIETLGAVGSTEYTAAQQILARLDADIVALQEVQWDLDEHVLAPFASDAGYPHVVSGWPVSFGDDTQVILSRHPVTWSELLDGPDLQPGANDVTRAYPVAGIDIDGIELVVSTAHFKSGSRDSDEFRRAVDAQRAVQALQPFDPATDHVLFCGDLNEDLHDSANWPAAFTFVPDGMPWSYDLGSDMWSQVNSTGVVNDPFAPFLDAGLAIVDARQLDGSDATRPSSGRRLDYVLTSPHLQANAAAEVYDTWDDDGSGLPKPGPLPTYSTLTAADHLPVVVDLRLPTGSPEPTEPDGDALSLDQLLPGDLRIREVMANPDACSDSVGEWVEVQNTRDATVDLTGLQLCDRHGCGVVDGVGTLLPSEVTVLARTDTACGVTPGGTFTAALSNGGDDVALLGAVELDRVDYASADPGISWVFDDDGSCKGTDGGTPGEALDCEGQPLGEAAAPWSVSEVPHGVLVLTELMPNPADCPDHEGEWVEVHNSGDRAVDLSGLWLADEAGAESLDTALVLSPGDYALFARTEGACGVDHVDATFGLALSNGGDTLQLQRGDGDVLDEVGYGSSHAGESWLADGCWTEPSPGLDGGC